MTATLGPEGDHKRVVLKGFLPSGPSRPKADVILPRSIPGPAGLVKRGMRGEG